MNQKEAWNKFYLSSQWNKETGKLPNIIKNKIVLELGVGNGKTLQAIIRQKPREIHAVDFSEEAIKICKSNFKQKNIFFHRGNILSLAIERESFDVVVCYYILNNLNTKERKKAVREMRRILKPSGFILFEDFSLSDFRLKNLKKVKKKGSFVKGNGIFIHGFKKSEVKSLFSGFKAKKIKEIIHSPFKV